MLSSATGTSSTAMSSSSVNNSSYSNERPSTSSVEVELASDPASGGFFHSDYKKHDDLKQMLDSNKDSLKLEAMKRIIGMVAKGRDASDLFPAVVKNVVSKNIEVKKLVYVYLVRYAEEQQDLALLSISTFQRALKDPNQLIRASALRVLSSIRVPMIVPIVMLAIRDSASDMSPYVRKTAAHAIPKLYSLDPEQKDELIIVIEKLLSDRTTLVVGSAVMAFEEVCPERTDLVHKNYRKLCNLLVDVDEWGQVIIINMMTRYARTQFVDPNVDDIGDDEEQNKPFYEETTSDSESDTTNNKINERNTKKHNSNHTSRPSYTLDSDHRLLLRNTKPLLQSRNASVVMSVAQLYHHIAPRGEVNIVAKALIRLLRSHREVQSIVLNSIASVSTERKGMFEPYLKSFFVRTCDPTHIKLLKLEILTNLATETSISVILREFQTYISSHDKEFVAAAIQAIGRCAATIKEVTDTCLSGLVHLLSNRDESVVAESVVVIKKLLQTQPNEHRDIIVQMAKLMDFITVPAARASILWLLGEYSERVPKIAPDVLRKLAKIFIDEEDIVKLQVMNLAVKLYLTNPSQTELLCQYIFNLARYDQNYDIRDRARFLKQIVLPANGEKTILSQNAHKIFLAPKPAPLLESKFKDREQFQLGSLSHYINARASGYRDLPQFPVCAPDNTVREVESPVATQPSYEDRPVKTKKQTVVVGSFYSDSDRSSPAVSDSNSDLTSSDEEGSSSGQSGSGSQKSESRTQNNKHDKKVSKKSSQNNSETNDSESDSTDSDDSSGSSESSSTESSNSSTANYNQLGKSKSRDTNKVNRKNGQTEMNKKDNAVKKESEKSNFDLLLDLDDLPTMTPVMTPSMGGFLTPLVSLGGVSFPQTNGIELVGPSYITMRTTELLNKINGHGLTVSYRFTRSPHLFSPSMLSIELTFSNLGNKELTDIRMGQKYLFSGMSLNDFAPISVLGINSVLPGTLGIDFNDSTQPANFEIVSNLGVSKVCIKSPIGELVRSVSMPESMFNSELSQLRGMNEHSCTISLVNGLNDQRTFQQKIYEIINVANIPSSEANVLKFSGQTLTSKSLVLITIKFENNCATVFVNCEKMVVGSMLLNEIKNFIL